MTSASQVLFSCHFGPRYLNGDVGPLSLTASRERSPRLRSLAGGPEETRGVTEAGQTFSTGCGPEIRHIRIRRGVAIAAGRGRCGFLISIRHLIDRYLIIWYYAINVYA
jgi:hypothetical protein